MIQVNDRQFILQTKHTSYILEVSDIGYLSHLYYGKKGQDYQVRKVWTGDTVNYSKEAGYSLENVFLDCSGYGKGDILQPIVEILHEDGSYTSDFIYDHYEIHGKQKLEHLPSSYGKADTLTITMKDPYYKQTLLLNYSVFEDSDVIVRSTKLINESSDLIHVKQLHSSLIDFDGHFTVTTFTGNWAYEMNKHQLEVNGGKFVMSSFTGTSSSRTNPFFMISEKKTTENKGNCYGFNLIYSGNHYSCLDTTHYGKTRVVQGLNPVQFDYRLNKGESLCSPEAVITYSIKGFNGVSENMHHFVRNHIVRGVWQFKERPTLINSWEAAYFNINEENLLALATKAKETGIEMLVVDDGWFGKRNDDTSSLGDWYVNTDKLCNGITGLCKKVKDMGLLFGLWFEPEMVNTNSNLYRAHPNWAMQIEGKPHSEGRNQRILDLCNPEVQQYIYSRLCDLFASCEIDYVKWDFNRVVSDLYSPYMGKHQGETMYRYYVAFYDLMEKLVRRFPNILFEGCSGGGNRFDLGILCYFPQIWASDNTDAVCRQNIQNGYSYGYPQSTYTCHVSVCPNHQTGKITTFATRYNVAKFGVLGYELNLAALNQEELAEITKQVKDYKKNRKQLQYGQLYRTAKGWRIGKHHIHLKGKEDYSE